MASWSLKGRVVSFGVSESFSCFSSLLSIQFLLVMAKASGGLVDLPLEAATFFSLVLFRPAFHLIPNPCLVPCSALIVFVFKRKIKTGSLTQSKSPEQWRCFFLFLNLTRLQSNLNTRCCLKSDERLRTSPSLPLCSRINNCLVNILHTSSKFCLCLKISTHHQFNSQLAQTCRNVKYHGILTGN